MLVWGTSCLAIPGGGPPPPPDCAADIAGHLTATPSSIDRENPSDKLQTTLSWSITGPSCPVAFALEGSSVGRSGRKTFGVLKPRTFSLTLPRLHRTLATVTVAVAGDPGFITVSPGRQVTTDDITKFDQQWMQPFEHATVLGDATSGLQNRDPDRVWETGEHMAAMVRMYDLTFNPRYLDDLHEFAQLALRYRDDLPFDDPGVPRHVEQLRNKVGVPAWGGWNTPANRQVEYGGLDHAEEVVSGLYAYPIAAFARIVAENPSLQAKYGDDAVEYANRISETVAFFMPQIRTARIGNYVQAWLTQPAELRNRPTRDDCDRAYQQAMTDDKDRASRWSDQRSDCYLKQELAGRDLPHNINLTFAMVLIELARVLDTNFYLHSPKHSIGALAGRDGLVLTVLRQQRYFASHINTGDFAPRYGWPCRQACLKYPSCAGILCWYYEEDMPPDHGPHPEDLDHGAMDMSYVDEFLRNYGRINLAAQQFEEPLAPPDWQGFARTFVNNTQDTNFRHDVVGNGEPAPYDANSRCEGWVAMARADSRVYQACRDVSLRIVDGKQPYLDIGNHSSLLANKKYAPQP